MKRLCFAYPGDLETPTGGYGYDRNIIEGLKDLGWQVDLLSLGEGYPFPAQTVQSRTRELIAGLPDGTTLVIDGLAFGVMDAVATHEAGRLDLVALVHHPLCRETGLDPERSERLLDSERKALAHARHVIVTSHATAEQVADLFAVPREKITVILPGTDIPDPVKRSGSATVQLLSVGTVVPRKGYDLLLTALAELKSLDWTLNIVGGLEADPECFKALQAQLRETGLSDRVSFEGAVAPNALPDFYRSADVFVLASRYEGYGMAYTEALAHGLPVVGSGGGAVRDTLPPKASIYCGIEDTGRLHRALDLLIRNQDKRTEMAVAARDAAAHLPGWDDAARLFAQALEAETV